MIDWDRVAELREEVGKDDFEEVQAMFVEEIAGSLDRLAACDAWDDTRDELHFLKGNALNLGFSGLAGICTGFEQALVKDRNARPNCDQLARSFSEAREKLENHTW